MTDYNPRTATGIPTEPVGSLPRPSWLQQAYAQYDAGEITREQLETEQDRAVKDSIEHQEQTGTPIISDGEQRWSSFATYAITDTLAGTGLADHLAGRRGGGSEFVFTSPRGVRVLHNNFYRREFKEAVTAAGLPSELRFHDLRHTCAALLIGQGAHARAIKEHLGHSSITVTMDRYGHLFPDERERLAAALDAAYAGVRNSLTDRLADFSRTNGTRRDAPTGPIEDQNRV